MEGTSHDIQLLQVACEHRGIESTVQNFRPDQSAALQDCSHCIQASSAEPEKGSQSLSVNEWVAHALSLNFTLRNYWDDVQHKAGQI